MSQDIVGQVLFEVRLTKGNPGEVCDALIRDFMSVVEDKKRRNPLGWRDSVDASQDSILLEIAAKHGMDLEIGDNNHYVFVEKSFDPWAGWN